MPDHTDTEDTPGQDDPGAATTPKETKLDRIANEVASRAVKREQRFDRDHEIFTS
jgi:hypothetical protein